MKGFRLCAALLLLTLIALMGISAMGCSERKSEVIDEKSGKNLLEPLKGPGEVPEAPDPSKVGKGG